MGREKPHGGFEPPLIWFSPYSDSKCVFFSSFPPLVSKREAHLGINPLHVQPGIQLTHKRSHSARSSTVLMLRHLERHREHILFCQFRPHSAADQIWNLNFLLWNIFIPQTNFPTSPPFLHFTHRSISHNRQVQETCIYFRFQFSCCCLREIDASSSHFKTKKHKCVQQKPTLATILACPVCPGTILFFL